MIASNEFHGVLALLLHPGMASLTRRRQVVAIGEIKAIFEIFLYVVNHLLCLLIVGRLFYKESERLAIEVKYLLGRAAL